ncbi:MAG: hypothetical protein N3E41_08840 [Thermofilaceae archaeon]|nr:hypothetical protein [Thermofilaceae archaeon]
MSRGLCAFNSFPVAVHDWEQDYDFNHLTFNSFPVAVLPSFFALFIPTFLSILSQLLWNINVSTFTSPLYILSILSQLLGEKKWKSKRRLCFFQFFPSCIKYLCNTKVYGENNAFNSFPVASGSCLA